MRQLFAQCGGVQLGLGLGDEVGDQALVAGGVLTHGHQRIADAGAGAELGLDLAQFDAEAAQLDLEVVAAVVLQGAIGPPAAEIAGAVHARIGLVAEGIGQEALGGQIGAIEVAISYANATDEYFADTAKRNH
ncbi:hypothetical protein NB688_004200 [Xanthomonas sacchari]|uniref:Uncharacterized protein n=1 Tax=Xanthomonas sacchari TaxID=56458 RepID=A0ABT3E294_9XANT|nr:hypothetical protein [Xanthomonas sacchari]MCW0401797.1 hypothetical protein [Xanthomonas sacchari]MCW0422034.1 hypothetical protein [Xanthomonas sacchari]